MGEQKLLFDTIPDVLGSRVLSRLPETRRSELIRILAEVLRRGLRSPSEHGKEGDDER